MIDDPLDPLNRPQPEALWRHPLSEADQKALAAWLEAHPEERAGWEAELRLSEALERLPNPPVASNFTAQVWHAVERDKALKRRKRHFSRGWWRAWVPRVAVASVVMVACLTVVRNQYQKHEQRVHREQLEGLTMIADVPSLPAPEWLQDFEAIQALKTTPVALRSDPRKTSPAADEQLLSLLQ